MATLASCSRFSEPADLTFINGGEPESLDPAIVTGQLDGRIVNALFEGLTARNRFGEAEPAVAQSWDVSPDKKTYTFHLRPAQWSNGDPVTTHDFFYSWKRVLEPATASRYAEQLYYIVNAEDYHTGKLKDFSQVGLKALDDRTLQVQLKNPTPFFIDLCAFTTLLPVHRGAVEKWGDDWVKPGHIVTNGAYLLEDWRIDDRIRLRANPRYWRASSVRLKRIDALPTSQATTAFNIFYTGMAHLVLDKGLIPPFIISEIRSKPFFHSNPFLATYFYRFNTTRAPFNNPLVRQALALAIDKNRIVEKITKAGERPAGTLTPPGIPGYEPPPGRSYNPQQAKQLLAQAGFPGGKNFPSFTILYNSSELNEQIATEIQAMWQETLGIRATLRNQEWKVYLNTMASLDYDVARSSWVGDYNDPYTFLGCFVSNRGNNMTGYSSRTFDALLEKANATADPAQRMALMREAETILTNQDMPIAPLYYYVGLALYDDSRLGGFEPNVVDEHPLRELYWKH